MIKSVEKQILKMSELYPQFVVQDQDARQVSWIGFLKPIHKTYIVRVDYKPPLVLENFKIIDIQPNVRVLDPILESHPEYEEGPIPHIYPSIASPKHPYLCLFYPDGQEWSPSDYVAETTIPWAVTWFVFYEIWLATKKWEGGGRHPRQRVIEEVKV